MGLCFADNAEQDSMSLDLDISARVEHSFFLDTPKGQFPEPFRRTPSPDYESVLQLDRLRCFFHHVPHQDEAVLDYQYFLHLISSPQSLQNKGLSCSAVLNTG
jgi:hypothetical protein